MEVTNTQDDAELVTVSAAADISGLSVATIRRYANKGILESVRTAGNYRLFRPADVRALITPKTSALAADQSSTVAVDSTEHKSPAPAAEPSVSSGAEDVPPAASAPRPSEAVAL